MKLPLGEQAVVPEAKLVDYLLSDTHPQGRGKALFFRQRGFQREAPDLLRREGIMLRELELAALRVDLPSSGLVAGDVGTVVLVHGDGEAYEVEFVAADRRTLAVAT